MKPAEQLLFRRDLLRAGAGGLGAVVLGLFPGRAAAYTPIKVQGGGRIEGLVRYGKRAPRPAPVKFSGDCAYCRKFKLTREELLVSGGGLQNVVAVLHGLRRGKALPRQTPVLTEERCTFVPHVMSVCAGSKLLLHNRDPVLNTFHAVALPSGRTLFNIGMPNKDQQVKRRIRSPGLVKMLCDVHPWEVAYVAAFAHPYHAVSDATGKFTLTDVPQGRHQLTLWHEKLGGKKQQVVVQRGKTVKLELKY